MQFAYIAIAQGPCQLPNLRLNYWCPLTRFVLTQWGWRIFTIPWIEHIHWWWAVKASKQNNGWSQFEIVTVRKRKISFGAKLSFYYTCASQLERIVVMYLEEKESPLIWCSCCSCCSSWQIASSWGTTMWWWMLCVVFDLFTLCWCIMISFSSPHPFHSRPRARTKLIANKPPQKPIKRILKDTHLGVNALEGAVLVLLRLADLVRVHLGGLVVRRVVLGFGHVWYWVCVCAYVCMCVVTTLLHNKMQW